MARKNRKPRIAPLVEKEHFTITCPPAKSVFNSWQVKDEEDAVQKFLEAHYSDKYWDYLRPHVEVNYPDNPGAEPRYFVSINNLVEINS